MLDRPEIMSISSALAGNAAARLSAIAGNIANADTPGYRAVDVAGFRDAYGGGSGMDLRTSRPGHIGSAPAAPSAKLIARPAGSMSPNGNSVSLEDELMRAAMTRQDHEMALAVYKSSLDILRASLGRR